MKIKKAMLSLGLVLAAAGVATASAWVYQDATASTQGAVDQGIILDWGEGSTLGDLTSLTYGSPVVQKVTVKKPQYSEGVTGYAKVSFALSGDNISTIQVEVNDEEWSTTVTTGDATLNADTTSYDYYVDITSIDDSGLTYWVRYSLTAQPETQADDSQGTVQALDAKLTVSLDYSETNPGEGA